MELRHDRLRPRRGAIHESRSFGKPARDRGPCGPLVSYTRTGGSPPDS